MSISGIKCNKKQCLGFGLNLNLANDRCIQKSLQDLPFKVQRGFLEAQKELKTKHKNIPGDIVFGYTDENSLDMGILTEKGAGPRKRQDMVFRQNLTIMNAMEIKKWLVDGSIYIANIKLI